jgi:hypothetical protein
VDRIVSGGVGGSVANGGSDRRRIGRIPIRCAVVVREKLATWDTETEDVAARGCRIVLKRAVAPGALLRLSFQAGAGAEALDAVAQVAWTRKSPPSSAGVTFLSAPQPPSRSLAGNWIDRLLAAHLRDLAASGVRSGPGVLGSLGGVTLRLGKKPELRLMAAELAVVKLARDAGTLATVACAVDGPATLATLLENGTVTVGPATVDPLAWKQSPRASRTRPPDVRLLSSGAVIVPPAPDDDWIDAVSVAAVP